jgi:probable HAF family extracellular repeat protein
MFGSRLQRLALLLLLIATVAPARAQSPQYTVTDLGAFFYPRGINDSGQVAGSRLRDTGTARLYSDGVLRDITPPNGVLAQAWGINNLGEVVGEVMFCDPANGNCNNSFTRGFIYNSKKNTYNILGTLGGRDSRAYAINDLGQVTGYSYLANSGSIEHAFIFRDGTLTDIGAIFGPADTLALGINASGQVAGYASSNTAARGAFLYDNGSFLFIEPSGIARDVNNRGELVGNFGGSDDGTGRAFLYTHGARLDLGTLAGGGFARANAVNNLGHVVGVSGPSWFVAEGQKAFIFDGGAVGSVMKDLNTMVPAVAGRILTEATDINDAGQIVANGKLNDEDHGFLLTPTQPLLLAEPNTNQAIAVQSVIFLRDPFRVTTEHNLSSDTRTRLTILVRNLETMPGETLAPPTVQAEDSLHRIISLPVEFFGKVPKAGWLTQIVVRLPDELNAAGELQLTVTFRDRMSNKAVVTVGAQ